MRICVFEDSGLSNLYPLTLTRPAFDLRCGAASLLERQERGLRSRAYAVFVRSEMAELCRLTHPRLQVNDAAWIEDAEAREMVVLINARWLAPPERIALPDASAVGLVGEEVA